jgi:hypothetical protein
LISITVKLTFRSIFITVKSAFSINFITVYLSIFNTVKLTFRSILSLFTYQFTWLFLLTIYYCLPISLLDFLINFYHCKVSLFVLDSYYCKVGLFVLDSYYCKVGISIDCITVYLSVYFAFRSIIITVKLSIFITVYLLILITVKCNCKVVNCLTFLQKKSREEKKILKRKLTRHRVC